MATIRDSRVSKRSSSWVTPIAQLTALACLIVVTVSGCSRSEPAPRDFVLADQRSAKARAAILADQQPAKGKDPAKALEDAKEACKYETGRKGIASIFGIVSRLREGSIDEDYVACMKARGYTVEP